MQLNKFQEKYHHKTLKPSFAHLPFKPIGKIWHSTRPNSNQDCYQDSSKKAYSVVDQLQPKNQLLDYFVEM